MFSSQLVYTCFLIISAELCTCQRKLFGELLEKDASFAVYLLRSVQSDKKYYDWICGGTLISESQVLTSAACLLDVSNVYVIAGLGRYVNERDIDTSDCIKTQKRQVVKFCYPTAYNLNFNPANWIKLDVGVATVDKPYDFSNETYLQYCGYMPRALEMDYNSRYLEPDTPVQAYGWGHRKKIGKPDANTDVLHYALMKTISKTTCKEQFEGIYHIQELIDKFMVCTNASILAIDRKSGLCENDHGGPLIAQNSSNNAVLIGVAVTSLYNEDLECIQPSIFISLSLVEDIIKCLITNDAVKRLRCSAVLRSRGYKISEVGVHWAKDSDKKILHKSRLIGNN